MLPPVDQTVEPAGIAEGSDGNLWYTYSFRQDIGRITPSGIVTDFPTPTTNAESDGIASGSDGALWFTEFNGQAIGRMTTSGSYSSFSLPPGSNPQFVTRGPDGALWFTEEGARRIGRIATNGTITEFAIPGSGRGAEDIVTGSDGALWFTDPANSRVGRLSTSGTVTYFPIPPAGARQSSPGQIAAGPDGALWVTDDDGTLDRITTGGTVTKFADADAFGATITAGSDGGVVDRHRHRSCVATRNHGGCDHDRGNCDRPDRHDHDRSS
jgi:virginiamycin B lyase